MDGIGRFRVNVLKQRGTTAIIMRHVKSKIPDYRGLNLPEKAIQKIAGHRRGMILVTGTTGSGKSTTLAAIIGKCLNCGYDLTRNESGKCPECGCAIEAAST